ncbi:MAG: DNA-directed RNA polymerase specialized sigma24 family protein [Verrucomicrobiales bacterium]|jgi:DNA-directed RNA polymerase specialized sigma24 family protein
MDLAELEHLYDTHAESLFRYLYSMVVRKHEVLDLLQDLFLKIARNPHCLDEIRDPKAYLFRLAHNCGVTR